MGREPMVTGRPHRPKPRRGDMNHRSCRPFGTLRYRGAAVHGLTPMATSCRPFGTKTLRRFTTQGVCSGRGDEVRLLA